MQNLWKWPKSGDDDGGGDDGGGDGIIFPSHPGPIPNALRDQISRKVPSLRCNTPLRG